MDGKRVRFLRVSHWLVLLLFFGCSARSPFNRGYVSDSIERRIGVSLSDESYVDTLNVPAYIELADGLSENEAVAIALWNNAQFQADLVELGFARAELI